MFTYFFTWTWNWHASDLRLTQTWQDGLRRKRREVDDTKLYKTNDPNRIAIKTVFQYNFKKTCMYQPREALAYSTPVELRQLNGPMDGVLHLQIRIIRVERQHSGGVFRRGDKEGLRETCIQLHLRFGTCPVEDTRTVYTQLRIIKEKIHYLTSTHSHL